MAVAFRPLRDRVQDVVDRRFHRARYQAVRRMADFLEALRAGRAAPEEVQGGSLFRIANDLRFARDQPPYKPYLDFAFWEATPAPAATRR